VHEVGAMMCASASTVGVVRVTPGLAARTTVLSADVPRELVTRTDADFGLEFEVGARLVEHAEARKELDNFKALVERETSG
jgi:hypothetical protein